MKDEDAKTYENKAAFYTMTKTKTLNINTLN